jgi:hypothetical protein
MTPGMVFETILAFACLAEEKIGIFICIWVLIGWNFHSASDDRIVGMMMMMMMAGWLASWLAEWTYNLRWSQNHFLDLVLLTHSHTHSFLLLSEVREGRRKVAKKSH